MTGINTQDEAQNSAELKVLGCFTSANGAKAISKALNYVPNGSFFLNPHRGKLYDLILFAENWAKKVRSDKSKQPKENYLAKLN